MIVKEFNYTPKGNLDFIDDTGQDVTGEINILFPSGKVINNFNHKYIKIPEEMWGYREVTLTDKHGRQLFFDDSLINTYFTNETEQTLKYVFFRADVMCFGIYPNNDNKLINLNKKEKIFFEGNYLGVKVPYKMEMPYFFEVFTENSVNLVNYRKKSDNEYLLDLTSIDLNEIKSIYFKDYKFNRQINYCIYENKDEAYQQIENSKYDQVKLEFTEDERFSNKNDCQLMGQLGENHFSIDENFRLDESFLKEYRDKSDKSLEVFEIKQGKISQVNYSISSNLKKSNLYYLFKNNIIILGSRVVTGDLKKKIVAAEPLKVSLESASDKYIELVFPEKIWTLQIITTSNNLKGPFSEIPNNIIENKVHIEFNDVFNDLGVVNGVRNMNIFANVSFENERSSSLYKLQLANNNGINKYQLFDNRRPLPGGVGKYQQYIQVFKQENTDLIFLKGPLHNLVNKTFNLEAQVKSLKREQDSYKLTLQVEGELLDKCNIQSVRLINRNILNPKENDYTVNIISENEDSVVIDSIIDLEHSYIPFYWDLFVVLGNENINLPIQVSKLTDSVKDLVDVDVFEKEIRTAVNTILYPYVTAGGSLAFTYRNIEPYENEVNFNREIKAYNVYNHFKKYLDKKNIWIVFEKNSFGAHDNAFHFFKYMYENEKHPNTYYVIRKDSPEYKNLSKMQDRVLVYMSFKYFLYMFSARVFISSDTKFHAYNLQRRDSLLAKSMLQKKNVFLQHGMNGIKKVPVFHKKRGLLDLIIAPSDFERDNINIKKWGYSPNEVVATGYARWDSYIDKTDELSYHQIFMMPTWRKSMEGMSREEFLKTRFYKEYQAFLKSPKLKEVLKANNTRLAFFLHPYFKNYVDLFDIDESFTDKYGYLDVDMGNEIMKSSMMISDYSSVVWDMFYLEKPVIFYQFDQEDYLKSEGAYLNYEKDLFGDVVFNSDQAVDSIIKYVENGFSEENQYSAMRKKYMNFHDHQNSERIYQAILSKKKLLGIENKWTLLRRVSRKLWKLKKKILNYNSNTN
ncbi:CDP-glycerol glycerophosphotransferase family protein [Weissella thailandensis]|uniref:Uncharacterized protein n=1 Tax=Weissella thailandensis TaxID=89061 RepID=A0ABX9I3I0_9LACO|nr:CDP-glycerol glycerophosphotransferase family protein [Weissella thailandensis]NKY91257.1 hypothetical protein [Weissella thailandensis]RDS59241.1 hypothetical protein DWV05_06755 [Weissella thailandensis]GEP74753.1 hypothetical protein WTH01_10000 [Weissella thailandensis]